ncbi:T-cell-specific guanine nucleotide triphosphate-binding protein 2-like isoform X2 [Mya arenaria]|uniref:T-cell-specific guanine nucleotide triphosphate-binding protein 2-like isoform X2 n=2 Tax=Mya arenaria TaxID=6604 RepID=UPI0022E23AFC|nr:T-cell-specific guanine nucleotide triphosphate-binding protein 2-like isoform X2 [Mya arenaria]XP_052787335.1 T-cell-specific guanine nucleotide triphosphate-binding protein 2-like isoform X2 [Mya arenaria]XP_052787336.1 T-cell-specific guanine nucleotide triphosphate-binding protein 2-like isoform X2 [Mya arenaria]
MAGIIEEDQISMLKAFQEDGLDGLKQMIINNRDKWESIPIRIAVTGNSGVGKSSFINAFLGLKPNAAGAAAVGVAETTMEVKAYPHPKNNNFVLYDLPGVGTQLFPRESYLQKVDFKKYDFFMILSATRFTENDAWLSQQIKEQQKKFFFVRTKIDIDMQNERDDCDEAFNQDLSLHKIREDAEGNLNDRKSKVYLITTKLRIINQFDYNRLMKDLMTETPELKKDSLVLFLPSLTEAVILEKEKVLSKRAPALAIASAIAGAIPLPGVSAAVDGTIIATDAKFYMEQFNLDEKSLKDFEMNYSLKISKLNLATRTLGITAASICQACAVGVASEATENVVKVLIPGLGSAIAGVLSYGSVLVMLWKMLNTMKEDALTIILIIIIPYALDFDLNK